MGAWEEIGSHNLKYQITLLLTLGTFAVVGLAVHAIFPQRAVYVAFGAAAGAFGIAYKLIWQ